MARERIKNSKVDIRLLTAEQAAMSDNDDDVIDFTDEQKSELEEYEQDLDDLRIDDALRQMRML